MSADLRSAVIDIGIVLKSAAGKASLIVPKAAEPGCRPGRSQREFPRTNMSRIARLYRFHGPTPANNGLGDDLSGDRLLRKPNFAIWRGAYFRLRQRAGD